MNLRGGTMEQYGQVKKISRFRYALIDSVDDLIAVIHHDDLMDWLKLSRRYLVEWPIGEKRAITTILDA